MEARAGHADVPVVSEASAQASPTLTPASVRWGHATAVLSTLVVAFAFGLALVPPFRADLAYQNAVASADVASLDSAEGHLMRAIVWTPQDAYLHQFLGEIYYRKAVFQPEDRQAYLDAALAALERSARLNPSEARTFTLTGWTYLYRGDAPVAEAAFLKAKALDPNNAYVRYSLGTAYLWQKKLAAAKTEMMFARRYLPNANEVQLALKEIERLERAP